MCGLRISSSHALCRRVRSLSAAILTPLARSTPPSSSSTGATFSKTSLITAPAASSPDRPAFSRLRGPGRNLSPPGPSDAFPSTLTRPAPPPCGGFTDRPGLPPPARHASWICRSCFRSVRPWAPILQRFLPIRHHPGLSVRVVLHAVSHLAMPRLRGCQLQMDAFSRVGVVHALNGSLLSWSFPPFEDDLPASPHTSAGLLSWASLMFPSPTCPARLPPRFVTSPSTRALFRVSENRKSARCYRTSSVGFLSTLPSLFREVEGMSSTPRGRDRRRHPGVFLPQVFSRHNLFFLAPRRPLVYPPPFRRHADLSTGSPPRRSNLWITPTAATSGA